MLRILLLESIHSSAVERFVEQGHKVIELKDALQGPELVNELKGVHVLGIRSKTKVKREILEQAPDLQAVGCFGVGTNQVELSIATSLGIPVFNAPYASTRSVAELTVAEVIMLARRAVPASIKLHRGEWQKSASGCYEVLEKKIGIVGYGHIGQQVGLLAEHFGLQVYFYDVVKKLPLGRAQQVTSLDELLQFADFVSLHMPALDREELLVGERELKLMKQGSFLLNFSRGSLVDLPALKRALESGHLAGAAIDVYAKEPQSNKEQFQCELTGMDNVILTPHIGGSTEEAQRKIGLEVSSSLLGYLSRGTTVGAVNFPQVNLPPFPASHRILNIHQNVPGVLSDVNRIISDLGANVDAQYLSTYRDIGYLIVDINRELARGVGEEIEKLGTNIKTRVLY